VQQSASPRSPHCLEAEHDSIVPASEVTKRAINHDEGTGTRLSQNILLPLSGKQPIRYATATACTPPYCHSVICRTQARIHQSQVKRCNILSATIRPCLSLWRRLASSAARHAPCTLIIRCSVPAAPHLCADLVLIEHWHRASLWRRFFTPFKGATTASRSDSEQ
jgi:hypothetical protein